MKLPVEKAAYFLTSQFQAFVPEGFRTPLIPVKDVSAQMIKHQRANDAVELNFQASDGTGDKVQISWTLRFPSGDFLEKKMTSGPNTSVTSVIDEFCDVPLKLCVPKEVIEIENGSEVMRMKMTGIELNTPLPISDFTLIPPSGFETENHTLEESGGKQF